MGVRNDSNEPLTMLDYACGNGVVSRVLAPRIKNNKLLTLT